MKIAVIVLAIMALIFPASLVSATGYGNQKVVRKNQVQYNNNHNDNVLVIKQKRVEFDARIFDSLDGYYSVGENLRYNHTKHVDHELVELKAKLDVLLELLKHKMDGKPNGEQPVPQPEPIPDDNTSEFSDLDKEAYAIFRANCASCHGANPVDNSLSLLNAGGLTDTTLAQRVEIYNRVRGVGLAEQGKRAMPLGKTLSDEDVETLYKWQIEKANKSL